MNWNDLTMAQKNELMQTYIRNGVTSLEDMRSHFNSFAEGGLTNPDNPPTSETPTLNEYLARRAAEEQQKYYLEGSRNRKESEYLYKKLNDDTRQKLEYITKQGNKELINTVKRFSDSARIPITTALDYLEHEKYPKEWNGEYEYWYNTYNDIKTQVNNAKFDLKENKEFLANCIATATANNPNPGHYVTGNQTFRANPSKYGWKEVSKDEIKPGGLIQMAEFGSPTHAVILDSKEGNNMYVNYSPGNYPEYKKHVRNWVDPKNEYFYNFVGNSADSTRWTNEYEQLYGKHKLGGYLFATGGPKDPPTVLPVNEEGLPYYTLPDLEVTAERLPQAKATDANIQRYANAVASGQLKLTQIPNTELRNRVRAKPIVDQIMRDRDKTLAPILMGTVGMPAAIIGGISAAPTVAAIMNNPIVDAGLTIHGAATAPRNIKEGVQEIREGEYGRGALDLGLTALDLYGAGKLMKHGYNAYKRLTGTLAKQKNRLHKASYTEDNPFKSDASTNDLFSRIIGEDYYRQIFNNENPLISLNKLNKGEDFREIPISQKSKERFEKQVFPRLFADPERTEMLDVLYGSEASKELAKRQIMEDLYSQKQYIARPRVYEAVESVSGKASGTTAGMHYPEKGTLLKDTNKPLDDILDYAEGHELRHELQDVAPRTSTEEKILKDAYSDVPNPYSHDYDMSREWETMNFDARKALGNRWPKIFNDNIVIQNKVIDKIEDKDFIEIIENSDSYWREYIRNLREQGVDLKSKIPAWKEAMKKVGMIVTPAAIGASISKSED